MQYDDLAIRVSLRQLSRRSTMPVCLCDEGEIVYFGRTAYQFLWIAANGTAVLRQQETRGLVFMDAGVGVNVVRPLSQEDAHE